MTESDMRDVLGYEIGLLVIPSEFDPGDAPSAGRLSAGDAGDLLAWLENGCRDYPETRLPATVVAATLDRAALCREPGFVALKLWWVVALWNDEHELKLLSYAELDAARVGHRLYRDADTVEFRRLAAALGGIEVVSIPAADADALFPGAVPACDKRPICQLLMAHPKLNPDPVARAELLRDLRAGERRPADAAEWRGAVRYLLHARHDRAAANDVLLAGDSQSEALWRKIADAHLAQTDGKWRAIDARLAGQLGEDDRGTLAVARVDAAGVAELLGVAGAGQLHIELTDRERDEVLRQWHDKPDLLRAMPIHDGVGGGRHRIAAGCFWQINHPLTGPLAERVTLLRLTANENVRQIQRQLADELRPGDIVSLALDAGPADHWDIIIDNVGQAGNLRADIRDRLAAAEWVPTSRWGVTAPNKIVIDADEALDQEIGRVLDAAPGAGLFGSAQLAPAVRGHAKFDAFRNLCSPKRADLLSKLAAPVAQAGEAFRTGVRLDGDDQVGDWLAAFDGVAPEISRGARPHPCGVVRRPGRVPGTTAAGADAGRTRRRPDARPRHPVVELPRRQAQSRRRARDTPQGPRPHPRTRGQAPGVGGNFAAIAAAGRGGPLATRGRVVRRRRDRPRLDARRRSGRDSERACPTTRGEIVRRRALRRSLARHAQAFARGVEDGRAGRAEKVLRAVAGARGVRRLGGGFLGATRRPSGDR